MTPAVSILVPVYNVSKYIERCAHSLFQQTFEDIEYVFVNDCTPDDSIEKLQKVIEQYPNRKKRIKIIHHEKNRGLAAARITAIDNSTGKYIQHIDSDDYIEIDMIASIYQKAQETMADMVVSDSIMEFPARQYISKEHISEDWNINFTNILKHEKISANSWNKLIIRDLYKNNGCLIENRLCYYEDWLPMIKLFFYAKKVAKIDRAFYHYTHENPNAITAQKKQQHFTDILLFYDKLEEFLSEKNIIKQYEHILEKIKLQSKSCLIFDTNTPSLRYEYRNMFIEEEKKLWHTLKPVEKVMFFCSKRKYLLWVTQIIRKLLLLKAKLFH